MICAFAQDGSRTGADVLASGYHSQRSTMTTIASGERLAALKAAPKYLARFAPVDFDGRREGRLRSLIRRRLLVVSRLRLWWRWDPASVVLLSWRSWLRVFEEVFVFKGQVMFDDAR